MLCNGFIGSVRYLTDDIFRIGVPLSVLSEACSDPDRLSEDSPTSVHLRLWRPILPRTCCIPSQVSINYSNDVDPIWVVINACGNGFSGVVAQGKDWCNMKATFQKVRGRCILFTSTELDLVK